MHLGFIFQSRDFFPIVNGTLKKAALSTAADKLIWEKKDKQAIVAILATLDSHHKAEVINCTTSHEMWMQLQAYHDQHSDECIIALQEKYYGSKLPGSALSKYCKYTRACTKGVLFRTSMYKMYVQETYCY